MEIRVEEKTWFVLKGIEHYGPYNFGQMIHLMQNKIVYHFDYIWSEGQETWSMLSNIEEFSKENIEKYRDTNSAVGFERRQMPRIKHATQVLVHDNVTLWTGETKVLSQKGSMINVANPMLIPGDVIKIHFKKTGSEDEAFNCIGEVLAKNTVNHRLSHNTAFDYAVKFIQTSVNSESQLQKWIQSGLTNLSKVQF